VDIQMLKDRELVTLLVGEKTAAKLYRGSLLSLLFGDNDHRPHPKLSAALEFSTRLLYEQTVRGPPITHPKEMGKYLSMHFIGKQHEVFVVVFLDTQHRVLAVEEMFRGTIDSAEVHPREVVRAALRRNAAACVFAHNHPSGNPEPSSGDRALTIRLKQALALVEVRVLDHLVVAERSVVSLAERGWV
jgi:DNA repair protein RadC